MCLYVKKGSKMKVAREPITVYKVLCNDNKSEFYKFQYKPNALYRLRRALKVVEYDGERRIYAGFHSFADISTGCAASIAYGSLKKLVEFTIPKGAKYYIGTNNEIVSTSIRSGSLRVNKELELIKTNFKQYGVMI